jgi:hypothetical protein
MRKNLSIKEKKMRLLTAVLALSIVVSTYVWAAPGGTTSDADSRIIEIPFTTSTTYAVKGSGSFFTPTSIMLTFVDGSVANTVDINLTRGGVERDIMDYVYTGRTLIWYLPNSLFLMAGDVITITNTDGSAAIATLNLQF